MSHTLKSIVTLLCLLVLISACKKDERTAEEWGELAEAKLQEMDRLGENLLCEQQTNISIQEVPMGCTARYFPVLSSDIDKFNRLKSEYQRYSEAQAEAWAKEGWVYDTMPCWAVAWVSEQPLRLECKNNRIELITTDNISIAEAKTLAEVTHKEVMDYLDAQTCTNAANWVYTALIKDKTRAIQFVPYSLSADSKDLKQKVSRYNRLMIRIIDAEGSGEFMSNVPAVKGVECVNGKPTIQLIN